MPTITEGVDFDVIAREWRFKWSADDDKVCVCVCVCVCVFVKERERERLSSIVQVNCSNNNFLLTRCPIEVLKSG